MEIWIIVDDNGNGERHYVCKCGFDAYLAKNCNCEQCEKYRAMLPLKICPKCGVIGVVMNK